MKLLHRFWHWSGPSYDAALRVWLGLYMVVVGGARLISGNSATPINLLPSRIYGLLLASAGIGLLWTARQGLRHRWAGRLVAIASATLWLLLIGDAWGAWVSITGAFMIVCALLGEVRAI